MQNSKSKVFGKKKAQAFVAPIPGRILTVSNNTGAMRWVQGESVTSSNTLESTGDVNINLPLTDGQILTYNSGTWQNLDAPARALNDMTDVTITGPVQSGDVLRRNATVGGAQWVDQEVRGTATLAVSGTFDPSNTSHIEVTANNVQITLPVPSAENDGLVYSFSSSGSDSQLVLSGATKLLKDGVALTSPYTFSKSNTTNSFIHLQSNATDNFYIVLHESVDVPIVQSNFIMDVDTTLQGDPNQMQLRMNAFTNPVDTIINWGDTNTTTIPAGTYPTTTYSHTYSSGGIYTIEIEGVFNLGMNNTNTNSAKKIIEIKQWGDDYIAGPVAFFGCENLTTISATDTPQTFQTNLTSFFARTDLSNVNTSIQNWDVCGVQNFSSFFFTSNFNVELSNWGSCLNSATTMNAMFLGSTYNSPLLNWNFGPSLFSIQNMFKNNSVFNQPLDTWTFTSSPGSISARNMFESAFSFNQPLWASSYFLQFVDFREMFRSADAFNQDIGDWQVDNVTDMLNMFFGADTFNNGGVGATVTAPNNFQTFGTNNLQLAAADLQADNYYDHNNTNGFLRLVGGTGYSALEQRGGIIVGYSGNVVTLSPALPVAVDATTQYEINYYDDSSGPIGLDKWQVGNVINFNGWVHAATLFNQPTPSWPSKMKTTGSINSLMSGIFINAQSYNQDVSTFTQWLGNATVKASNDIRLTATFTGRRDFQRTLGAWDFEGVSLMNQIFDISTRNTDLYHAERYAEFVVQLAATNTLDRRGASPIPHWIASKSGFEDSTHPLYLGSTKAAALLARRTLAIDRGWLMYDGYSQPPFDTALMYHTFTTVNNYDIGSISAFHNKGSLAANTNDSERINFIATSTTIAVTINPLPSGFVPGQKSAATWFNNTTTGLWTFNPEGGAPLQGLPAGASQRSISLFMRLNSAATIDGTNGMALFSYGVNAPNEAVVIKITQAGALVFGIQGTEVAVFSGSWTVNIWYHIAITLDSGNNLTFYVNGTNIGTGTITPNTTISGGTGELGTFLGQLSSVNGNPFYGDMTEIGVWDRPLTFDEIQHLALRL